VLRLEPSRQWNISILKNGQGIWKAKIRGGTAIDGTAKVRSIPSGSRLRLIGIISQVNRRNLRLNNTYPVLKSTEELPSHRRRREMAVAYDPVHGKIEKRRNRDGVKDLSYGKEVRIYLYRAKKLMLEVQVVRVNKERPTMLEKMHLHRTMPNTFTKSSWNTRRPNKSQNLPYCQSSHSKRPQTDPHWE